ncbi:MAG: EamA family transporter [Terriglobales bacterium]
MTISMNEAVPVLFIITGGVLYHVAQKSTPRGVDPFLSLFLSFGLAALACLAIAATRGHAAGAQFRSINWTAFVLAGSLVGIESGYLIGYRNGLKINITSFACNTMIAVVLLFLGALFYGERFTARNTFGAVLCIAGLLLLRF